MPERIQSYTDYDLGKISGVPLGFTDACFQKGIWFTASAEDTHSTYDDGPCLGSAIGYIEKDGELQSMHRLLINEKPEGIWVLPDGDCYVVTDADDISQPSRLYYGKVPV